MSQDTPPLCTHGGVHVYHPATDEPPALTDVVAKARAGIEKMRDVQLYYVSYDERLHEEQVQVLLRGENPYESKEFSYYEESIDNERYRNAHELIRELLTDEEWAVLEDDTGELDELRFEVYEKDTSDWYGDALRNTPNMLLRYDLGCEVNTTWNSTDGELRAQAQEMVRALGISEGEQFEQLTRRFAEHLLPEASYGGRLQFIWYADVARLVEVVDQVSHGNTATATITFTDAQIMVYDGFNGSGHEIDLPGSYTVPFDPENVVVDKCAHHSWTSIAGPYEPAYKADVTFAITEQAAGDVATQGLTAAEEA